MKSNRLAISNFLCFGRIFMVVFKPHFAVFNFFSFFFLVFVPSNVLLLGFCFQCRFVENETSMYKLSLRSLYETYGHVYYGYVNFNALRYIFISIIYSQNYLHTFLLVWWEKEWDGERVRRKRRERERESEQVKIEIKYLNFSSKIPKVVYVIFAPLGHFHTIDEWT